MPPKKGDDKVRLWPLRWPYNDYRDDPLMPLLDVWDEEQKRRKGSKVYGDDTETSRIIREEQRGRKSSSPIFRRYSRSSDLDVWKLWLGGTDA